MSTPKRSWQEAARKVRERIRNSTPEQLRADMAQASADSDLAGIVQVIVEQQPLYTQQEYDQLRAQLDAADRVVECACAVLSAEGLAQLNEMGGLAESIAAYDAAKGKS